MISASAVKVLKPERKNVELVEGDGLCIQTPKCLMNGYSKKDGSKKCIYIYISPFFQFQGGYELYLSGRLRIGGSSMKLMSFPIKRRVIYWFQKSIGRNFLHLKFQCLKVNSFPGESGKYYRRANRAMRVPMLRFRTTCFIVFGIISMMTALNIYKQLPELVTNYHLLCSQIEKTSNRNCQVYRKTYHGICLFFLL